MSNSLDRLLHATNLADAIPRLSPDILHRVIQHYGLEACSEVVALATAEQLQHVLDLDLWRGGTSGIDETFDADRFGVWLDVLLESGADAAARQLRKIDLELVIAGIAEHVRVFDRAAPAAQGIGNALSVEIAAFVILSKRPHSWTAIVETLASLAADHPDYFHQVMRGCRRLSNSGYELDGLDDLLTDGAQAMHDLAIAREQRREQQGFPTAAQARAFLAVSRQGGRNAEETFSPVAALFRAYGRGLGEPAAPAQTPAGPVEPIVNILVETGVIAAPRALLAGAHENPVRLAALHTWLQAARARDAEAYVVRLQELAFLANTLVAGCSIQGRPLDPHEGSEAAAAVCNLGLEQQANASRADGDLLRVFQDGWTFLYQAVSMRAAKGLIDALKSIRCVDRETQAGLNALRIALTTHWRDGAPWRARDAMEVLAILDVPAWAALLALVDELPVIHAALTASRDPRARSIDATAFTFISENGQVAAVHAFLKALPATLAGV